MNHMLHNEIVEEIMENVMDIIEEGSEPTMEALADRIGISPGELGPSLDDIRASGYLRKRTVRIIPTKKGMLLGKKMVRKHRLLERFLHDVLGFNKERVHDEACRLEHGLSDEAENALCRFLKHPGQCPDDNRPIPVCDLAVDCCEECDATKKERNGTRLIPLTLLEKGKKARVRFIRGGRNAVRRLRDMGLVPDMVIRVLRQSPFGGPVELEVCMTKLAIGRKIAMKVYVEEC